jgi:hypothetical protein
MSSPEGPQQTSAPQQGASPQSSASHGPAPASYGPPPDAGPSPVAPQWPAEPAAGTQGYAPPGYGEPAYNAPPVYPHLEPTYSQTSTTSASFAKKVLLIVAIAFGAVFMTAILAAVAIPTFLTVKEVASGDAWFNGGVPGWPRVNSSGLNFSGGAVVQAWEVQGAHFSGPGPYVAVIKVNRQLPAGETARQYFSEVALQLEADGDDADLTVLSDGSPAAEWTKPDGFAAGSSDYYLYAKDGSSLYMVYLEASAQDFTKALELAKPVMFNFKGTD